MKLRNKTATLLGAGFMSAVGLLMPGAALAEDTYTVSDDLMAECTEDGLSEGACECIIGEISAVTGITEFDLGNIEGAVDDYIEVKDGDVAALDELFEDCVAEYP
ncbi:MAG: hypothetical protein AAGG51_08005 [Cyanobacteria bacterium P01_G01_bin.54]